MHSSRNISIGDRSIGSNEPAYIIAEIGVNHNGDISLAHRMIDAAAAAGADAVKFQTFITDEVILDSAETAEYQARQTGSSSQRDMVRKLELSFDDFYQLNEHCRKIGIDFISTAFDPASLDFVISLKPACLKWPSGEITNWPLLRQARDASLPVLLSTGMASMREIAGALDILGEEGEVAILQCVSNYPAKIEDQNLRALPAMAAAFNRPVGLSDHTLGPYAAIAATALGMSVLEKHFTLDRNMEGPDHAASSEPTEFAQMIEILRKIEMGLGDGVKKPLQTELNVKSVARKSLVYRTSLPQGHILAEGDLIAKRPASGVSPDSIDMFCGLQLKSDVEKDQMVKFGDVVS